MSLALSIALVVGFASVGLPDDPPPPPQAPSALDLVTAFEAVMADAIARAEPSVVAIARDKMVNVEATSAVRGKNPQAIPGQGPGFRPGQIPFQFQDIQPQEMLSFDFGSGVVIGPKGEILTAFHVVKGASRLLVRAEKGQEFEAEVIAADPRSDLAVIAPREGLGTRPRLTPIVLGDSTKLRKGSFLIALGNPFNAARDGKASATFGILSNLSRRIDPQLSDQRQLRHYPTLLQLDSKLNLGMSGGAVVNLKGELVGLTTNAGNVSGFDAQAGYAMPLDRLGKRVIATLLEGKEVEYGFLGINLAQDLSNLVGGAPPGTPAAEGGLVIDDRIISVGGIKVTDSETLVAAVNAFTAGDEVKLEILRQGRPMTKTIVLAKFPTVGEIIATNRPKPWRGIRVDYLSMLPNGQFGATLLEAMARGGVGIVEVTPGSPAEQAGLKPSQVIRAIGGVPIRTPSEFYKALEGKTGPVEFLTEGNRTVTVEEPDTSK